jgi:RNA methyltransferase, TrmH family
VQQGELTAEGLLPIEGPKLLDEALRSGINVLDVFLRRGVGLPDLPKHTSVYELDAATFKSIQSTETSQGVVALVHPPAFSFDEMLKARKPLIGVLGRLQDPGNVGTIMRLAESFYATGCIALTGTASIHNPKVVRSSAGSVFRLAHVWDQDIAYVSGRLRNAGIKLVGTAPTARHTIEDFDWQQAVAVFIGNEGQGMSDEEIAACDEMVRIPQNPDVESLNSAIAAAIIFYKAQRQK